MNNNGPKIDPCGAPKRISNHELKVESSAGNGLKDHLEGVQNFSYELHRYTVLSG